MIHFFIPGEPVAKGRSRSTKSGRHYTPKKTADYESLVAAIAREQMIMREPTSKPVKLDLVLFFEIPKTWPKWKQEAAYQNHIAHTSKPDADNVIKAIKDGLNKIVWIDDAQVCELHVMKLYSSTPGVLIDVTELTISPSQTKKLSDFLKQNPQRVAA
tara:strand:- start:27565 stop:28038 length:474 start_codon:yes stop_codon:yes gene_type:complete